MGGSIPVLHDMAVEVAALRCAIVEPELFRNHIEPGDFGAAKLGAAWAAGRHLLTAGRPVTFDTLTDELERVGVEAPVALVNDLYNGGYESPAYFDAYAETIQRWARYRQATGLLGLLAIPGDGGQAPDTDAMLGALIERAQGLRAKAQSTPQVEPWQTGWTAAELLSTNFPEPRWTVEGLIPVGLAIVAARPKVGKSLFSSQTCIAVGTGGMVLGRRVTQGKALYIALEDNGRRLQDRLSKQGMPHDCAATFVTSWRPLAAGGTDDIARAIDAEGYTLVVLDTFGRSVRGARVNDYGDMTDLLGDLQAIAIGRNMTIMVIDHAKKPTQGAPSDAIDDLLGSTGKSGAADAVLKFTKSQGQKGTVLSVTGRDVIEQEFVVKRDPVTLAWQYDGTVEDLELAGRKGEVLAVLRDAQAELTLTELVELTGIAKGNLVPILNDLVTAGHLERLPKQGKTIPYRLRNADSYDTEGGSEVS